MVQVQWSRERLRHAGGGESVPLLTNNICKSVNKRVLNATGEVT